MLPGQGCSSRRFRAAAVDLRRLAASPAAKIVQKILGQQEHVVCRVAQRRQIERHHVQPEIQILAEPLRPDHLGEVLIRGRQQSGVGMDRRRSADADQHLLLDAREAASPGR